jgi:hypothetical protein
MLVCIQAIALSGFVQRVRASALTHAIILSEVLVRKFMSVFMRWCVSKLQLCLRLYNVIGLRLELTLKLFPKLWLGSFCFVCRHTDKYTLVVGPLCMPQGPCLCVGVYPSHSFVWVCATCSGFGFNSRYNPFRSCS